MGIIDKHYRDLGKPPSGEKHGTYTKEARGLPMENKGQKTTSTGDTSQSARTATLVSQHNHG
jgi:hypothetical protein